MSFDQEENSKTMDWGSISKFVLSNKKKHFKRALDKLNQIKSTRFDRKIQEGVNSEHFKALLKASKRNVKHNKVSKPLKIEPKPQKEDSPVKNPPEGNMVMKIFNINFKNFKIPERRGTAVGGMKRFSNLHTILAPSESDMKAMKDEASVMPTNTEAIIDISGDDKKELNRRSKSNINLIQLTDNVFNIKLSGEGKSPKSDHQSVSNSSDDKSVSNEFVINIKQEENKCDYDDHS